ncbi:CREB-binding protein-like [Aphidius gifuensis]|uniref:CREB-binding protein-like n=1 Tax=Aphidius gifuensis TaxID=684658 RepID=UPI001CDC7414|nr:CREB-binding protein-like [Aphidius gifuensis]
MSKINNENIEPNMMMNQNKTNDELVIIHEIINSQTADPYSTGGILTEEDIMIHQDRMRKQLLLMIHAQRCNLNDKKNNNKKCTWILCECMQKTFIHMSNCYKTTDCGTPHCYSSKTIAKHWKTCLNENCFLCKPIRLQEKKQNLNLATTSLNTTEKQMPIRQIELHQMIINNNDGYTKQWQMNLSQDLRNHFIFKLVEIMHPKQITINQQKQLIIENNNQQVSQELRTNVRKQKPRAIPIDKSFKPSSQLTSTSNNTGKVSSKPTTLSSSVTLNSNTQSTSVAPNDQQPVELPTVSSNLNIQSASVTPNDQQPVASPTVPSNLNTQLTLDAQNNNQQKNIETPTTELTSDTLINKQTLESSTASLNSNTQSTSDAQNNNQQENIETPTDTSQPIAQLTSDTLNDERAVESPGASSNSSTQLTFDTPGNYQTINNEAPSVPSANQASVIKSLETQSDENQTMDIDEIDNTNENEKIISTIEQLLSNNIPNKPQYKKYKFPMKQNDLAKALKPVFYRIYNQHPEASPFHRGVSRTHSKLSNYYDIIKNPIDLSIIGRKINGKKYYEPWEFVDDIWLLIENAWLYNTENSRIYGYAKKLSVIFEETMIPVMTSLGYCCAKSYKYNYDNLICCAKEHLCFFGMYVQEYNDNCQMPNTRKVYVSHFDTYVKKLGYTSIHLWSRPPAKNQDFIFNKHPYEQIILDAQQLQKWINKMVDFIEDTIDKAKDNDDACKDDEKQLGPINDPDLDIDCDLMNERSRFVNVTRDNYLEFSTLRCAKFSTMVMLSEIHKQSNYFHKNKVTVDRRIAALTHGYQCTDDYCQSNDCNEMKKVIKHSLSCLSKFDTTDCAICKEFIQLKVCHAKSCRLTVCPVRSCLVIKKKLLNKNLIIVNSEKRKRSIDNDEDSDRSKKIQKVTNDSSLQVDQQPGALNQQVNKSSSGASSTIW